MTVSPEFDLTSVLRKMYIDPIQNIVIIDDEYKTLWDMQNTSQETVESEATTKLSASAQEEDDLYEEQADLNPKLDIKIDYTSSEDIVVENYEAIAQKIMDSCKDEFILHVDNRPDIPDKIIEKADFLILDYYLTKVGNPENSIAILKKYIERDKFSPIVIHSSEDCEAILCEVFPKIENLTKNHEENYIWGEGFFIVILNKINDIQDSVQGFFNVIIEKMNKQPPTPLFILAQSCINNISQQSNKISHSIFSDAATRAGILYHILTQPIDAEDEKQKNELRCKDLVKRILEDLGGGVFSNIASDIASLITALAGQGVKNNEVLQIAKCAENSQHKELEIMLKLNAHLCSHDHKLDYITTGTIFKSDSDDYYLCTCPSCDSVPGRKKKKNDKIVCQRAKLNGGNYFSGILLEEIEVTNWAKALKDAEHGRHIFILENGKIKVFKALDDNNQPFAYTFYAPNGGYIDFFTQKIELQHSVFCEAKETLALKAELVTVIGQLRHLYASNLLQRFGVHNFRIGVDFRKNT